MTEVPYEDVAGAVGMVLFFCFLGVLALLIYLLPSVIAFLRKHHYFWIILALNIFGGLVAGIGWFIALIWAIWPRQTGLADVFLNDPTTNSPNASREIYNRYGGNVRALEESAASDGTNPHRPGPSAGRDPRV